MTKKQKLTTRNGKSQEIGDGQWHINFQTRKTTNAILNNNRCYALQLDTQDKQKHSTILALELVQDNDKARTAVQNSCEQKRQSPKWISQSKEIVRLCHLYCGWPVTLHSSNTELLVIFVLVVDSVGNIRGCGKEFKCEYERTNRLLYQGGSFRAIGRGLGVVVLGIGWITGARL
jgi:hypothetical protein